VNEPSADAVLRAAGHLYRDTPGLARFTQSRRPSICPFDLLVEAVPAKGRMLDIGCGAGLFLGLIATFRPEGVGIGFDSSRDAISIAQGMSQRLPRQGRLEFEHRDVQDSWPDGLFDVVSMVDVLHHVPSEAQGAVVRQALGKAAPGGIFIYKDMAPRPLWAAMGNRLHDLALARQWIHYFPVRGVEAAARDAGFRLEREVDTRMLWYAHEFRVFRHGA